MIENINIAITNRCNLKCLHCSIWQERPKKDISLSLIKKILSSKSLAKNPDITLTGGEPFLHKDYLKIIKSIIETKPCALKTISTNGTLKSEILSFLKKTSPKLSKDFQLHISLDGINKHKKQRAVTSAKKILNTIDAVQKSYPNLTIKIKFTITTLNYDDIIPTYNFAKSGNIGFKIKLAENAKNYTNKLKPAPVIFSGDEKKSILKDLLLIYKDYRKSGERKEASFIKDTMEFLVGAKKKFLCKTPFERIFVMPDGSVYSCIHFEKIGNIKSTGLTKILKSAEARSIREKIKRNGCNRCVSYHGYQI